MGRVYNSMHHMADRLFGKMGWYNSFFHIRQLIRARIKVFQYIVSKKSVIKKNLSFLSDEKSKKIYLGMIKFRIMKKDSYFPGYEEDQYFPKDIINIAKGEVFVDCGGYDGDTSLEFINRTEGNYKQIVLFEPNEGLQDKINTNLSGAHNVITIKKGVWDKNTNICFNTLSNGSSKIIEVRDNTDKYDVIEVTAIDNCDVCREATFIKMDIEGAEWEALHGAEKTIVRNHPTLAICIYHSNEDMVRIIPYIHHLCPKYRLYVRQHSYSTSETVLYAVI